MKNKLLQKCLLAACALMGLATAQAQDYQLTSPDGLLNIGIYTDGRLQWSVSHDGTQVLLPSDIALKGVEKSSSGKAISFGPDVKVRKATRQSVNTSFATPFYKKAEVKDEYNALTLKCRGGFSVEFRAYNDGAAYRLVSELRKPYYVTAETADFNFAQPGRAFIPYINENRNGERYCFSFESYYDEVPLSQMIPDSLSITPLLVEVADGKKATVMDGGVENYPGLFLTFNEETRQGVQAAFAPVPTETFIGGHNRFNLIPSKRADYIASIDGARTLPWRAVLVTTRDTQLADNDMAQRLAPACRIDDTSWIKPGKVAWDWWNACNLSGVDFKAGMNTPTYKAYIDFAAQHKLEYIIIDDGWSTTESLTENLNPDIDLPELIAYGNQKGVGIILWAAWRNAARNTEADFAHYEKLGIKGFKIDFFDRDDQPAMQSIEQIAACAARHHLLLDLHGMKPFGLQRAYPNLVNFEGVKGLENCKWEPTVNGVPMHDFPRYDVTIPYLRQLAGPMDYTPGATMNANRWNFRGINDQPMSQGTRVHQMAMYTVFEAPLQMLADSPSKYAKEPEYTDFIAQVPTTFDQTVALDGQLGEYIVLARRKGNTWFIAAMTNWTPRDLTIDLSFLPDGAHEAVIFSDGVNADRDATDWQSETRKLSPADKLNVHLAPGGGWTARVTVK
ncbi:MAG TPA: glycoside hydrolase family 97 protein [Candidatus Bacteroides merdipullorum]|uniref:Glycoside hydrolase family 97 protein n=1 Tax=Candidatus Bacteroides merdipullorum TaxID=2838474 RepID=A0A9D2CXM8_9BACE|nr:glycoside hydrolase family 97 protein [Candidatus Bacteroides merdipullorum]